MTALEVKNLVVTFGTGSRTFNAVDGVDLRVPRGKIVGLVGESGSGKSTVARTIAGLQKPSAGTIAVDRTNMLRRIDPRVRATKVQMIFQDPNSSLNPRMPIGAAIDEVLMTHTDADAASRRASARRLLELVRLKDNIAQQFPAELSGGMRQRVAIARCLAARPKLIIADEITSALDASVQGAVLNLIKDLQNELELSMLFITHNLAAVRYIAETTIVMKDGQVVESGESERMVTSPTHPYSQRLVDSIPRIENAGLDVLLSTGGSHDTIS